MVRSGLTPQQVLTNATARAGEQLGVEKLGTLTVGAPADVGVDGNPFVDLGSASLRYSSSAASSSSKAGGSSSASFLT